MTTERNATASSRPVPTRALVAWSLYDWANSAVATVVTTFVFATYFTQAVAIKSYVHLFADHFRAGTEAGLRLVELEECVIDEAWLESKPKWRRYLNWPVSFALVWRRG